MKNQEQQVCLYIATHNKTGLKYFGKTVKYFTQEELQKYYHGSGTYWKRHLKKHGNDITMEIYGIYKIDEVKEVALKYSEENNIVESNNWANLIPETGLEGGSILKGEKHHNFGNNYRKGTKTSIEGKNNMSKAQLGKKHSEKTKEKMSLSHKNKPKSLQHRNNMRKQKSTKHSENIKMYQINESIKEKGLFQLNNSNKLYTFGELKKISKNLYLTTQENFLGKSNRSKANLKRYNKEDLIGLYVINRYKRLEI